MLSINRRKKYQTGKTPEQIHAETVARETAQQQVANSNMGSIQQAKNMVLGSYQQPQQVFSDVAPVQNPQYLSEFTSNMVYAPTLSQYVGSDVPMKLALSNLKRKEDEFVDDFATTGVTGKDVLNPDLGYREKLLATYNDKVNKIANDPNMRGRDKYKAIAAVKNEFTNDLGLQRMYQNKANRDAFARQQQKDAEDGKITFEDARLNLADYDKEYENQKGVGENYTQGYNSKGFARIVDNEKFVNDALQGIEIDGNKYDTTGGYFSNGFYFVKNKGGEGYKQISAEKVYNALEGAINNNALLKARIEDEARVNTLNVNPDDYRQKYISNGTKVLEQLKGKIDKATGENKEALQQQYNTLATNIQTVNTLDANGIRKVAMDDYATNYKENLRRNASKKLKFEKEVFNDQDMKLNEPNFWMFKRGLAKADEAEERDRMLQLNEQQSGVYKGINENPLAKIDINTLESTEGIGDPPNIRKDKIPGTNEYRYVMTAGNRIVNVSKSVYDQAMARHIEANKGKVAANKKSQQSSIDQINTVYDNLGYNKINSNLTPKQKLEYINKNWKPDVTQVIYEGNEATNTQLGNKASNNANNAKYTLPNGKVGATFQEVVEYLKPQKPKNYQGTDEQWVVETMKKSATGIGGSNFNKNDERPVIRLQINGLEFLQDTDDTYKANLTGIPGMARKFSNPSSDDFKQPNFFIINGQKIEGYNDYSNVNGKMIPVQHLYIDGKYIDTMPANEILKTSIHNFNKASVFSNPASNNNKGGALDDLYKEIKKEY